MAALRQASSARGQSSQAPRAPLPWHGPRLMRRRAPVAGALAATMLGLCPVALPFAAASLRALGAVPRPRDAGRYEAAPPTRRHALSEAEANKIDGSPDELFYLLPRVGIHHTDDGFRSQLSQLYRLLLKPGSDLLDLCSQHDSHLPSDVEYRSLTVHGMNYVELLANVRATERFTRNFNSEPSLSQLADGSVDAVLMAVSIQYMQRPTELLQEARRVLRPGGVVVISFSNRMFFTKAVEAWRSQSSMRGLASLVKGYLLDAGFPAVRVVNGVKLADGSFPNPNGDPFIAAVGFMDAAASEEELLGVSWLVETGSGSIW